MIPFFRNMRAGHWIGLGTRTSFPFAEGNAALRFVLKELDLSFGTLLLTALWLFVVVVVVATSVDRVTAMVCYKHGVADVVRVEEVFVDLCTSVHVRVGVRGRTKSFFDGW
jgi:hypothetical protein